MILLWTKRIRDTSSCDFEVQIFVQTCLHIIRSGAVGCGQIRGCREYPESRTSYHTQDIHKASPWCESLCAVQDGSCF